MRFIITLLTLTAIAFASDTLTGEIGGSGTYSLPQTYDLLDTYAFSTEDAISSIPASFSEYAVVDDFTHPLICEMQKKLLQA